jgi:hypothetical protein
VDTLIFRQKSYKEKQISFPNMKMRNMCFVVFILFLNGCLSVQFPNISSGDISEICHIHVDQIQVTKTDNGIEFKVPYQDIGSQWIRIYINPVSIKELSKMKQSESNIDLQEIPYIGDEAFIYKSPLYIKTMLFVNGDKIYKIESIIENCNEDNDLIQIAEKIIS